jgi:hypothetical protein
LARNAPKAAIRAISSAQHRFMAEIAGATLFLANIGAQKA